MNRMVKFFIVCAISVILLVACGGSGDSFGECDDNAVGVSHGSPPPDVANTVCSLARGSKNFCQTDFARLPSNTKEVDGKEIWILGFLAVDDRQLVLYASKDAYEFVENGQSILLRSSYSNLMRLLEEYGNEVVRVRGTFRAARRNSPDSSRLGTLEGELYVKRAERRSMTDPKEGLVVPIPIKGGGDN